LSGSETSRPPALALPGRFVGGVALAFAACFTFQKLGLGPAGLRQTGPLATACLLAGLSVGVRLGRRRIARPWQLGAAAFVASTLWAASPPAPASWGAAALTVIVFALLAGSLAAGTRRRGEAAAVLVGAAAGLTAGSAGAFALVGPVPLVGTATGLSAVGAALAGGGSERRAEELTAAGGSRVLLAAMTGVAGAALLRAYLPAARSLPYAVADVGLPMLLGVLAYRAGAGAARGGGAAVAFGVLGCLVVSMLCGYALFLHPDLVFSESGMMQAPGSLLVAGRVFPVWLMAFVLGLAWGPGSAGGRAELPLMAAACGAAVCGLLAGSYRGPYVLAAGLGAVAMAPLCVERRDGTLRPAGALPVGVLGVAVAATAWAALADAHVGFAALRKRLPAGGVAGDWRLEGAALSEAGLDVTFRSDAGQGRFLNGELVRLDAPGRSPDAATCLAAAIGAAAGAVREAATVARALDQTTRALEAAVPAAKVHGIEIWSGGEGGPFDLVVCGPGCFSGTGNPTGLLSVEGLERVKARLRDGGRLALCLPAGSLTPASLRRCLSTLGEVFPSYWILAVGQDAVVLAPAPGELAYERLAEAQRRMDDAAFWDPLELLIAFVAASDELAALAEDAEPLRLSRPERPPALGRDLAGRPRAASLAALLQHRLTGASRLLEALSFASPTERFVALWGFDGAYAERTGSLLRRLGRAGPEAQQELFDFLRTPSARLELFAPDSEERAVRVASALCTFGIEEAAAQVLRKAAAEGQGSFDVQLLLGDVLSGLERTGEAVEHYRAALAQEPQSRVARERLAASLRAAGQNREAAETLEAMLKARPDSVPTLLTLARLYAGPLGRTGRAAELALRALELEPDNPEARELLALCRNREDERGAP
jgi:tetratricopeptide (TPR) repeat protein